MGYDHLCSDVISEILSRTPLKTVDKSKLVCKLWNELMFESYFLKLHIQRTKTLSGYFIQSIGGSKFCSKFISVEPNLGEGLNISLDFMPGDVQILASSDVGILCCVSRRDKYRRYYVCKPSTTQKQALPNPKLRYLTEKVALVVLQTNPMWFKIIRLSSPQYWSKEHTNYHCEIFDSKTWAWRELKDEIVLPYNVLLDVNPGILANGSIHWNTSENTLLTFDANLEDYTIGQLPPIIRENGTYEDRHLTKYQGRLAIIFKSLEGCLKIWVMDDYRNNVWREITEVTMEVLRNEEPYCCPSAAALYSSDIALMLGYDNLFFYKFSQCNLDVVKLGWIVRPRDVYAFRSDMEHIDFRGGNKK